MRPWYKKWPAHYPPAFYLCSERARHVYGALLDACGTRQEHDGLAIVAESVLQVQTAIPLPRIRLALTELVSHGLVERDLTGACRVPFFVWSQRKIDRTGAERQAKHREKRLKKPRVTRSNGVTHGAVTDSVTVQEGKDVESSLPSPVPSVPTTPETPPAAPRRDEPEWVTDLRAQYRALRDLPVTEISLTQRLIVARYYAFMLCRCTKSRATNSQRSSAIDAGLAYVQGRLGRDSKLADMTVGEFLALGRKRAKRLDVTLWKPADILAEVEFDTVPA